MVYKKFVCCKCKRRTSFDTLGSVIKYGKKTYLYCESCSDIVSWNLALYNKKFFDVLKKRDIESVDKFKKKKKIV